MKRLFLSAAALPLMFAAGAHAETKINAATTAPVRTSTAANGQPDSITIETGGSIKPTVAGAAVTADSAHAVTNGGEIAFNGVSGATGILLQAGASGAITNNGAINVVEDFTPTDADSDGDLDGPFAQGSGRYGIRAVGPGAYTGNVASAGGINVEGNDSAGISLETRLLGSLSAAGAIAVTGDRSVGVRADSVAGDVRINSTVAVLGQGSQAASIGVVDGGLVVQNSITATGYRSTTRLSDAARAKLDADDLKQGGSALRLSGSIARGVLLDRPPADTNPNDADEDKDGVPDAQEGTSVVAVYGGAPAIDIGGAAATTLGAVGTGDLAFGLVNKGNIIADGVNDGVSAAAVRIGDAVTVQGGIHNMGGQITAKSYGSQATGVLVGADATVAMFRNTGRVGVEQVGGQADARAIVDLSGRLALIENTGVIEAAVTSAGATTPGRGIAIDLTANSTGAVVRQTKPDASDNPVIRGEVLFGAGADRFELLGGAFAGAVSFGGGGDSFLIDGGAVASTRIADADGQLALDVRNGRLSLANTAPVNLSTLTIGAKGVLGVSLDPSATGTRFNVAGQATLVSGAQVDVSLSSLIRGTRSFQLIQAGSLAVGQTGVTLAGAPFLYTAALRADGGSLFVDLRPKSAAELGLNRSGAQAYAAVFDALDKDDAVEQAFLGQRTQAGFQGLYQQMLPDHSGGALASAAAIASAVSQAVAEPMQIDAASGRAVWAQEILFNIRRDRADAAGFKSQGFGFAAGADLQGQANAFGVNLSFVNTDLKDRGAAAGEEVAMTVLGGGVYWRLDGGPLQAAVRGGLGYAWFDGDRRLGSAQLDRRTEAKWNGWMADAHAQVSYEARLGDFYSRPELSVSYLRLSEDGYTEEGGGAGFDLRVDERKGDLLTGQALLALGWRMGSGDSYIAPELKVGYRAKLAGDAGRTTARFAGGQAFTLDPEDMFDGGAVVRFGVRGGTSRVLYTLNGGATFDGAYQEYDVRAAIRLQF